MIKLKQPHILTSVGFIICLLVLLINDFILKQQFHNWATGKLSDLVGLFIFPMFLVAFLPHWRKSVYVLTMISFIFWKSIYSQPLINGFNLLMPFSIGRTIDTTDLLAILVLPISYLYSCSYLCNLIDHNSCRWHRQLALYLIGLVSIFAFTATSHVDDQGIYYNKDYEFNVSREALIRQLYNMDLKDINAISLENRSSNEESDIYIGLLQKKICKSSGRAYMRVYTRGNIKSVLRLSFIMYKCDAKMQEDKRELLDEFEQEIIDKLRQQQK